MVIYPKNGKQTSPQTNQSDMDSSSPGSVKDWSVKIDSIYIEPSFCEGII